MSSKGPCQICRKWFRRDPRVGRRHRTCGAASCQQERHRRACAAWHARNSGDDREDRLRRRLRLRPPPSPPPAAAAAIPPSRPPPSPASPPPSSPVSTPPMRQIDWLAARDAVGLEVAVVLEVVGQVLWEGVRDVVRSQLTGTQGIRGQVPPRPPRDEIGRGSRAP